MTEHPLAVFLRTRWDEEKAELDEMLSGALVQGYLRYHGERLKADVAAKRQLLDQYERLLRTRDAHAAAVTKLIADIEHEERTGEWAGVGQRDVRLRALRREDDYLTAMLPVVEGLVKAFAAAYASHPEYPKDPS